MKRVVTILLACLLGLAFAATASPATAGTYADNTLTLTTQNLSLWPDRCADSHFAVTGNFVDAPYWEVDVTAYDPYGRMAGGDYFYKGDGDDRRGTVYLCQDFDRLGTYRVTADYTTYNSDYDVTAHRTVTGYFTFRNHSKYASTLASAKRTYGAHSWRVVGKLTKSGKAWAGHYVQLQGYYSGRWHVISSRKTNTYGNVSWILGGRSYKVRLYSKGGTYVKDAASTAFWLPRR